MVAYLTVRLKSCDSLERLILFTKPFKNIRLVDIYRFKDNREWIEIYKGMREMKRGRERRKERKKERKGKRKKEIEKERERERERERGR